MKSVKYFAALAAFFGAICLVGCGGTPDSGKNPGGNNPPAVTPGDEVEEKWDIPDKSWSNSSRIRYVRDLGYATGVNAAVDTTQWNTAKTDLGFAFFDEEIGRLYVAFGDTFNTAQTEQNSNVVLYTDNLDFTQGIKWQGALPGQNGSSRTITPLTNHVYQKSSWAWPNAKRSEDITTASVETCIPTGCLVLNGVYYMWYMEVDHFEATGEWKTYCTSVMRSEDKGQTWTRVPGLNWIAQDASGTEGVAPNFAQIYPLDGNDGYVYIYGIPGGRSGGVKLGRVAYAKIADFEEYEYFKGLDSNKDPIWKKGTNGLKSIKTDNNSYIVAPSCGELSVHYNPYLQRYVMTYMQNNSQIVMRRSPKPWGTWSSSDSIMGQAELTGLYGGMSHAAMMTHEGKRIFLLVSEWWPTYNVHLIEVVFE